MAAHRAGAPLSGAPRLPVAYLCLAASMALVGVYVALSKPLVAAFPVFLLAWLRCGIGAVAMGGWLRRAPGELPLSRHDRRLLFLESFLGNFLFTVCMLYGVSLSSALAAGIIMAAIPAIVAVLSWLTLGERISPRVAAGIGCAVAGIVLVSLARHPGPQDGSWLGNLLLFGAACCEASYVVIGKRLAARLSARRISAMVNLWGLLLVTPFGWWQAADFDFPAVQPGSWGLLLFYALAASVATVWLWMTGLKRVPASSAGIYTVLLPTTAAVVGVLWLGERYTSAQVAAFALALAGIVLATWPVNRPPCPGALRRPAPRAAATGRSAGRSRGDRSAW